MVSFVPPVALPGGKKPLSTGDATQSLSVRCRKEKKKFSVRARNRVTTSKVTTLTELLQSTYNENVFIQWVHFVIPIFRRVLKIAKSDYQLRHVCLSVCLSWGVKQLRSNCAGFHETWYLSVEIKCQLDATEVFIADLIACSTCFGHHYAHHPRVMCPVCRMLQHPANRTHNPQLHTRPATWKPQHEIPQAATTV